MTIPFWTILFVIMMPNLIAGIGDYLKVKEFGRFDNNDPRGQSAASSGIASRSWSAQSNAWEAAIFYVPSVLVAHLAGVSAEAMTMTCLVYCAARVAHLVFYLSDLATLRSLSFVVGLVCCLRLFWLAA